MFFDPALGNDRFELRFILLPANQTFFVIAEKLFSRSHDRQMDVTGCDDGVQEIFDILPLGKACQLRCVIQTHIYHFSYTSLL